MSYIKFSKKEVAKGKKNHTPLEIIRFLKRAIQNVNNPIYYRDFIFVRNDGYSISMMATCGQVANQVTFPASKYGIFEGIETGVYFFRTYKMHEFQNSGEGTYGSLVPVTPLHVDELPESVTEHKLDRTMEEWKDHVNSLFGTMESLVTGCCNTLYHDTIATCLPQNLKLEELFLHISLLTGTVPSIEALKRMKFPDVTLSKLPIRLDFPNPSEDPVHSPSMLSFSVNDVRYESVVAVTNPKHTDEDLKQRLRRARESVTQYMK